MGIALIIVFFGGVGRLVVSDVDGLVEDGVVGFGEGEIGGALPGAGVAGR